MRLVRSGLLWASANPWLRVHVPRRSFARRAVQRFMPGETPDAALDAAAELGSRGIGAVLTCLGEGVHEAADAEEVVAHYDRLLDDVRARRLDAELSVKPTHLGLDLATAACAGRLAHLAARCAAVGCFLWIDMEGSEYTDATLGLYSALRDSYERVGVCVQANLHRTPVDLDRLLERGAAIRLVKGAYAESATRAWTKRTEINVAYLGLAARLIRARRVNPDVRVVFGTHDLHLLEGIRHRARLEGDGVEVHMLYGIRRPDQDRLARERDVRVRVLISYGAAWYAWFVRRLAERPANLSYLVRALNPLSS